jgi:hypothetical protein
MDETPFGVSVSNFNSFTMNTNKIQAMLDLFEGGFPADAITSCQAWDDMTCQEQMVVESYIFEA